MKRIFITVIMVAAVLASCSRVEPDGIAPAGDEICFSASIDTRASALAFEQGDRMSVWAVEQNGVEKMPLQIGGNFINNECLTLESGAWKALRPLYWSDKPCDFYAIYPYNGKISSVESMLCALPTDQNASASGSSLSGYEQADLLYASAENVVRNSSGVMLNFHHLLSKCSVNIVRGEAFDGDIPDDISVHIYNTNTEYILDLTRGAVGKYAFGVRKTITMQKVDKEHFRAVVVPQNIELSTPLIEVTMGGIAYLLNYSISFKPGYNHTINITVNTSPDQEQFIIAIDPSVDPWK